MNSYWKLREGLRANVSPARGEVVEAMASRLRSALAAGADFDDAEVEATADPDRLVVALATYRTGLCEQDVVEVLTRLWADELRYRGWDVHAFLVEEGHVELQAASMSADASHYVTVHLVATAADLEDIPSQRGMAPPTSAPTSLETGAAV